MLCLRKKLLESVSALVLASFAAGGAQAAEFIADLEAGTAISIDGSNTLTPTTANDGVGQATAITFTNDATNANDTLTITPADDGTAGLIDTDLEIGSITVLDNNGTNKLIINDAADDENTFVTIRGDVNGNVATDANDLNITLDATVGNADADTVLVFQGNVNLGSGSITMTGNSGSSDNNVVSFDQSSSASMSGRILSTTNDSGSLILINNTGGTLTFNDSIGAVGTSGIAYMRIGWGRDANVNAQNTIAGVAFDTVVFNSSVDVNAIDIDADGGGNSIADFNGTLTGATMNLEGGATDGEVATAKISGNVSLTSITLDDEIGTATDDALLIFDGTSSQTITGTISGVSAGEGKIQIGNSGSASDVTFNSVIGGTAIDNIHIQSGATATFKNNVTSTQDAATDIGLNVDGTMKLNTSGNTVTVSDTVGDIDIDGTLNVTGSNNATLSAGSDLLIDGTFLSELSGTSKTLTLAGASSILIGGTSNTSVTLGNQVITNNNLTIGAGGRSNTLTIKKTADFNPDTTTVIDASGDNVTLNGSLTINLATASGQTWSNGETITVIGSTAGGTDFTGLNNITLTDLSLFDLQDDGSDANNLKIKIVTSSTPQGTTGNATNALSQALGATGSDQTAQSAIQGVTVAQANTVGEMLLNDPTGGASGNQTAAANTVTGFNLVSERLASLRDGSLRSHTGMSAGDDMLSRRVWGRAFGVSVDQGTHDGIAGFDADTIGFMVGMDKQTQDDWRYGVSLAYSKTNVDGNGVGNNQTDFDSYRIGLYGDVDMGAYYLEGQVNFAYNDISSSRRMSFNGLDRIASGETYGYEAGIRLGGGTSLQLDNGHQLIPNGYFHFVQAGNDDYTETGAGALNLKVDDEDTTIAELVLGTKYSFQTQLNGGGLLTPEFKLMAAYDFADDRAVSHQQFVGGGDAFQVKGASATPFSVIYGAGVTWQSESSLWEVSADYDGRKKSDYISHGARLEVRYNF